MSTFDWNTVTDGLTFIKNLNRLERDINIIKQFTTDFTGQKTFNDDCNIGDHTGQSVSDTVNATTAQYDNIEVNNITANNCRVGSSNKIVSLKADNLSGDPVVMSSGGVVLSASQVNSYNSTTSFDLRIESDKNLLVQGTPYTILDAYSRSDFSTSQGLKYQYKQTDSLSFNPLPRQSQARIKVQQNRGIHTIQFDFYIDNVLSYSDTVTTGSPVGRSSFSIFDYYIGTGAIKINATLTSATASCEIPRIELKRAKFTISAGNPIRVWKGDFSQYNAPAEIFENAYLYGAITD